MNKLVICSVGTSIATSLKKFIPNTRVEEYRTLLRQSNELPLEQKGWDSDADILSELKRFIRNEIQHLNLKENHIRTEVSAEINTLNALNLVEFDRVVLLSTDTAMGHLCSQILKECIVNTFSLKDENVIVCQIEKLQVDDSRKLREKGLFQLVKTVISIIEESDYHYDIIINPTGGYKGVVPFLTIIAMLYRKRCVYKFEFSNTLIDLPPLPFSFSFDLCKRAVPAIRFLDANCGATEQKFFSLIPNYVESERSLFLPFIESLDETHVTISPLAAIVMPLMENVVVKILPRTWDRFKELIRQPNKRLTELVINSGSALYRQMHLDSWERTDLVVLKKNNTSERVAGFVTEGLFHIVAVFTNHDEYERELTGKRMKNYLNENFIDLPKDLL